MQKFQDLLTEAAQLKQQQLKQERKNFEALPEYLKSGLNYAKKYVQLRKQHYLVQKYVSEKLKKEGNDQYLLQNYGEALSKYQEALSVFRYIHATKYENLKDEDIIYENYRPDSEYKEEHEAHLVALYLNICSALTKMNKKQEAIHSSEEALKLNESNPKIYYKKAQAYLQYINRETSDIKLGFYYLNKAYELSKDQTILTQMHKIKKQLDVERQKEKKWFKFMFDKNKQQAKTEKQNPKPLTEPNQKSEQSGQMNEKEPNIQKNQKNVASSEAQEFIEEIKRSQLDQNHNEPNNQQLRRNRMKEQFQRFRQQNEEANEKEISEKQKLERTKLNLKPYLIIARDDRWLIKYQQDFIHKHGSKIYSILQLYNYSEYLMEFKSLLAKCLQLKQAKITVQRDENKLLQQKISMYSKFVEWIKLHPIQKYAKYIERYDLQTAWIKQHRGKPLEDIFSSQAQTKNMRTQKDPKTKIPAQKRQRVNMEKNTEKQRMDEFLFSMREQNSKKQQSKESMNAKKPKYEQQSKSWKSSPNQGQKQSKKFPKTQGKKEVKKVDTHGFKEQWECDNSQNTTTQGEEVPQNLKGFLQNYEDFPTYQEKIRQSKNTQQKVESHTQEELFQDDKTLQQMQKKKKQGPFSFVNTFIVIVLITMIVKFIF